MELYLKHPHSPLPTLKYFLMVYQFIVTYSENFSFIYILPFHLNIWRTTKFLKYLTTNFLINLPPSHPLCIVDSVKHVVEVLWKRLSKVCKNISGIDFQTSSLIENLRGILCHRDTSGYYVNLLISMCCVFSFWDEVKLSIVLELFSRTVQVIFNGRIERFYVALCVCLSSSVVTNFFE